MPKNEVKNKILDLLADLVENILDINGQLNIPDLKSEESAAQRQQGQGLKILAPQQMITKLPILFISSIKGRKQQPKIKK